MQSLSSPVAAKIPILGETNYKKWSVRVQQLLRINTLWKYVQYSPGRGKTADVPDGTEEEPDGSKLVRDPEKGTG